MSRAEKYQQKVNHERRRQYYVGLSAYYFKMTLVCQLPRRLLLLTSSLGVAITFGRRAKFTGGGGLFGLFADNWDVQGSYPASLTVRKPMERFGHRKK